MSRANMGCMERKERFPRVSGDEPPVGGQTTYTNRFSPRERG